MQVGPLQLVIFRHLDDADTAAYEESVVRAFQGGKAAGGYLFTGEDLGVQLQVFNSSPPSDVPKVLNSFCHTLTVVLADRELLSADDLLWNWLEECWEKTKASRGRHAMIVVAMDERVGRSFSQKRPALGRLQLLQAHALGEHAIRPAMFGLKILHEGRKLLAAGLVSAGMSDPAHLRIFISHAKLDGLPLAHSLLHQIDMLGWLEKFYDVTDIPPGTDWKDCLERGVEASLIVILRTDAYDGRHWCQQEVLWADEYATPAIVVDARTSLNHPAGVLPLERMPTVRIPDGNLVRILYFALREGLRFLFFRRFVEQMKSDGELPSPVDLRVFSFAPSMSALLRACRSLATSAGAATAPKLILYPDPPLRSGSFEAAQALVGSVLPGARLVTPQTLAATSGGP